MLKEKIRVTKKSIKNFIETLQHRGADIGFYGDACGLRATNKDGSEFISPAGTNRELWFWLRGYAYVFNRSDQDIANWTYDENGVRISPASSFNLTDMEKDNNG